MGERRLGIVGVAFSDDERIALDPNVGAVARQDEGATGGTCPDRGSKRTVHARRPWQCYTAVKDAAEVSAFVAPPVDRMR